MGNARWRDTTAEASAAVLAAVVEHAGLGIALVGLDGIPFQANPAFCQMVGYSEDELLTLALAELTHQDDVAQADGLFGEMVAGVRDLYRIEKRYVCKDGHIVWGALTVSAVRRSEGGLLFAVVLVEDVTEPRQLREELRHQALHDHLTGLPNRRLFDDRLAHARQLARRQENAMAVVALDLDSFKAVNDTFGHAAGDEVLVAVAALLSTVCRDSDTVARVGGDEFVVLCEGPDVADHAAVLAQRIRSALQGTVTLSDGAAVPVSASVGVAVAGPSEESDALLRRADESMYGWKNQCVGSGP